MAEQFVTLASWQFVLTKDCNVPRAASCVAQHISRPAGVSSSLPWFDGRQREFACQHDGKLPLLHLLALSEQSADSYAILALYVAEELFQH